MNHGWGVHSSVWRTTFLLSEGDFCPGRVLRQEHSSIWGRSELDKHLSTAGSQLSRLWGTRGAGLSRSCVPAKHSPQCLYPVGQLAFQKNLEKNVLKRNECFHEWTKDVSSLSGTLTQSPRGNIHWESLGGNGLGHEMVWSSNYTFE